MGVSNPNTTTREMRGMKNPKMRFWKKLLKLPIFLGPKWKLEAGM